MQKLSNSSLLSMLVKLLILLAIAKIMSLLVWWFLPNEGVELQVKENYKPAYQRVDFKNMLGSSSSSKLKRTTDKVANSSVSITNMILKGLYGKGSRGMAIVALKSSSKKTSVVAVGEVFSGYTLKTILNNAVVFTKKGKEYTLYMGKSKKIDTSVISVVPVEQTTQKVARKDINDYIENRKDIWKDITIEPLKEGTEIKGFKVTRVKENSAVWELGLEKGDVIIAANNVRLTSYKAVLDIYKNIKTLKSVQLIVLRDNQEQELVYEID